MNVVWTILLVLGAAAASLAVGMFVLAPLMFRFCQALDEGGCLHWLWRAYERWLDRWGLGKNA